MDDILTIHRPFKMSEVIRASDFLIIYPKEINILNESKFRLIGQLRNFSLTNKNNIGRVYIETNGIKIWEHNFTENEYLELPFWRDLDFFDSVLLQFVSVYICIEPCEKDLPFSIEISYTPVMEISSVYNIKNRLDYIYELENRDYLFVADGCCFYIDTPSAIRNMDLDKNSNLSYEQKYEFYLNKGLLSISKFAERKKNIKSHLQKNCPTNKYLFYVYSHDVDKIQKDKKLKEIVDVSDYIVMTSPEALDISVESENIEKFKQYMEKMYPKASICEIRKINIIDEPKTFQMRLDEIKELKTQLNKILDSKNNVPDEISLEEFQNLPEESIKKRQLIQMREKLQRMF